MIHTVVFDNDAVQAILRTAHRKHRHVLALVAVAAQRKRGGADVNLVVPTTVRVEAGWDRSSPRAATANRLRILDVALDARLGNIAIGLRGGNPVSVVDAHVGAAAQTAPAGPVTVVTSDPDDIRLVCGARPVAVVAL